MIKLKDLLLENSNDELLKLLEEAQYLMMDIWRVCDDSIADYTLEIETAVNFANKALKTHDRLDIFRALQKAYDILSKEETGTDEDDEYGDIVTRLQQAIQ